MTFTQRMVLDETCELAEGERIVCLYISTFFSFFFFFEDPEACQPVIQSNFSNARKIIKGCHDIHSCIIYLNFTFSPDLT